jgi:hypothetical protein
MQKMSEKAQASKGTYSRTPDGPAKLHLPIGSGAVESGAGHIVQQRLKQSGMRWSDPGAQAILNLRSLHRNGEFEQYWANFAAVGF